MLRKFIIEAVGRQLEIYNISEYITDYITKTIQEEQSVINNGEMHEAIFPIRKTENIIKETKINSIKIEFKYIKKDVFKISGSFKSNETRLADNSNYDIVIKISIENDNRSAELLKANIESVISHELNHAFVFIKKINRQSKSYIYNSARKITEFGYLKTPELKEFIDMFYLALPEEIQARVQQTASELKYTDATEYNDTMSQLMRFNPLNDARKMMSYNLNNIKRLDSDVLDNFVKQFHLNIKAVSRNVKIKPITNTNSFFEYWLTVINQGGAKLFKRITRLVADKHNITRLEMYVSLISDESLLTEVTGGFFDY